MVAVRHRWRAVSIGMTLALVLGLGSASSVSADSVTDKKKALDKELAQLKDDLEGTAADLVAAAVSLRRSQAALVDARAKEAAAVAALAEARRRDADLAARLAVAEAAAEKSSGTWVPGSSRSAAPGPRWAGWPARRT